MTAHPLEEPFEEAGFETCVELVPLAHGLRAVLVVGHAAKAEALRRIARREAEREAKAKTNARRVKREALGRSNCRPGRRGGAALRGPLESQARGRASRYGEVHER